MRFLYDIIVHLYHLLIRVASPFNGKAKLWVNGRKGIFEKLEKDFRDRPRVAWFHAASLGEFEQGRPVMEAFRQRHPDLQILLTFFSPSGYEVRKNYGGADHVYYLPIDTRRNAKRFLSIVRPAAAVFIKYEFWFNYLDLLHRQHVPVYVISAIFRPGQHFFKPWGGWARRQLKHITRFFVQDENSKKLLGSIGITRVMVSGDTRFDRVQRIAEQKKDFPLIEAFAKGSRVLLAGSTWPPDEELILHLLQQKGGTLKVIIAPHEVHDERIRSILGHFAASEPVRYSQLGQTVPSGSSVLVIDGIGFLSGLYQYCDIALIGGGFGKGIHNILEAVTFGKPVLFGPHYQKFAEARQLVDKGGAFPVNKKNILEITDRLLENNDLYRQASAACSRFISENTGATSIILDNLKLN
jgi:3-deoxy-D-manno-octulosonic-acid transferase